MIKNNKKKNKTKQNKKKTKMFIEKQTKSKETWLRWNKIRIKTALKCPEDRGENK